MPSDLTGTPTPLGIGTYNTSVDAPSGLGFNEAMAQVDALIATRIAAPAGLAAGEVPVWNGTTWVRSSVTHVGPTSLGSGTPDATKFLRGDGTWSAASSTTYRKTTAKAVNTTVAATDLLNSEITVGAGVMGTTGVLRLTAWGDWMNNSGSTVASPRLQLVLGGTTLLDTGSSGTNVSGVTRNAWRLVAEIQNLGAAATQMSHLALRLMNNGASAQVQNTFTTGEGILTSITASGQIVLGEGVNPSTAVDTSVAKSLVLNVINGSASASYETKLLGALVEVI